MGNSRGRSTAARILDVAERLFADHGYDDTTLRTVVKEADVNIAAINYHFGSKDGLLCAVIARAMTPVNEERAQSLAALAARPAVDEVVRAYVVPALRMPDSAARLVGAIVFESSPWVRQVVADEMSAIRDSCLAALCRALPRSTPAALLSGYAAMAGLVAQHLAGITGQLHGRPEPATPETEVENLIRFIVAGFAATQK